MFKYQKGVLPSPINKLFLINSNRHNYHTRQKMTYKYILKGEGGNVYKLLSFHSVSIWNHILKKIQIDVSYACFKILTKTFLQNNDVPQRFR